jgi:hypothetical protein
LKNKYSELETATEDKWEEAKYKFSSAADSFQEAWSQIKSIFS